MQQLRPPNNAVGGDPLSKVFCARLDFSWGCLWAAQCVQGV